MKNKSEKVQRSKLSARSTSYVQLHSHESNNPNNTNNLVRNLSALQIYTNLFYDRHTYGHIGDANTHFKNTLRKYNDFPIIKNTKWLQRKFNPRPVKVRKEEHESASGDASVAGGLKKKHTGDGNMEEDAAAEGEGEANLEDIQNFVENVEREMMEQTPGEDVGDELIRSMEEMREAATAREGGEGEPPQETTSPTTQVPDEGRKPEPGDPKQGEIATADKGKEDALYPCVDNQVLRELEDAENQARSAAKIINNLKQRVTSLLCKDHLTDKEAQELEDMNKELMRHMAAFEDKTKLIQTLVNVADQHLKPITMPSIKQAKHREDMLPKVVVCGLTEHNMPKILICESKKKGSRSGSRPRSQSGPRPNEDKPRRSSVGRYDRKSAQRKDAAYAPSEPHQPLPPYQPSPRSLPPCLAPPCLPPPQPCSPCGMVPQIAKRLSESYDMQEQLAADNVDLEGKRYRLQEELVSKDKAIECLQRQLCQMQAEMRVVCKENTGLMERLDKSKGPCKVHPDQPCGTARGVCPADVENRLMHYQQATGALERQVEMMEEEVKNMQEELCQVRRERAEMECQRLMKEQQLQQSVCRQNPSVISSSGQAPPCGPFPPCVPPQQMMGPPCMAEQQLRELREQYNRLQDDYKAKLVEVAGLRADNDSMKRTSQEVERAKMELQMKMEELERECKGHRQDNTKLNTSKEMLIEQEQQLAVAKQRFREAQDELDELRACIQDQSTQLDDYRNKYLSAQQQVEEQRRQIDVMEMENARISEQVTCEIQRVKGQFQERLAELAPLPDILKAAQLKLQEEQHVRGLAERNADALTRELQMYKDKLSCLLAQIEKQRNESQFDENEKVGLMTKVAGWECKCTELQAAIDRYKTELAKAEEQRYQLEKRLEEKAHEIAQLSAQLDGVREESARQVTRTKERCETVRRSLQAQVAEMERQLAQSRAAARAAQKDRDDIRIKMQTQINNLNENFEEAQLRIRSLQGHVNFLKNSYTSMFGGPDGMCGSPVSGGDDESCNCTATY